jgi:ketosteroid isomerase-like protein
MSTSLSKLVDDIFKAIEAQDINTTINFFSDDGEFIDPHYPNVHMKGKREIMEGFTWGFNGVNTFSFTPVNYFENQDGSHASVEMDTKLELTSGKKLSYRQVFILETKDGKVSRCQAYEAYGPHGMLKIVLMITRFVNKLRS